MRPSVYTYVHISQVNKKSRWYYTCNYRFIWRLLIFFPVNRLWPFLQIVTWRQFAWKIKAYFLGKIRKIFHNIFVVCWKFYPAGLKEDTIIINPKFPNTLTSVPVAQSDAHPTVIRRWRARSPPGPATFFSGDWSWELTANNHFEE